VNDRVIMYGNGAGLPPGAINLSLGSIHKLASFILRIIAERHLHGLLGDICVEINEFSMCLAPANYKLVMLCIEGVN